MKGILKFSIYVFIGGWMFLLGIMVGRGNSPVTFDTRGFQERLASIAREYGKSSEAGEKLELEFYDALNESADSVESEVLEGKIKPRKTSLIEKPVLTPSSLKDPVPDPEKSETPVKKNSSKKSFDDQKAAGKKENQVQDSLPLKVSKKAATLNRAALARSKAGRTGESSPAKTDPRKKAEPAKKTAAITSGPTLGKETGQTPVKKKEPVAKKAVRSYYTIQVASYRALKDALSQMAQLDKKGFSSRRTEKKIKETVWHRVRCGSFATHEDAAVFLAQLKKAGFDGLIIKKE
ncbi:SPOR domain-containing protein [Desulfospira joergensenii]|uniref:SPOR domain-containing protein n=1 Tax=Desulfospira joergensenii TaxID=53329 RepID=UPI0003B3CB9E|nr:SPOR domain-containing protein [Desulfospira joergensenii]